MQGGWNGKQNNKLAENDQTVAELKNLLNKLNTDFKLKLSLTLILCQAEYKIYTTLLQPHEKKTVSQRLLQN